MFDYEVVKESNISLKKDLEMTKDRLDSLLKEHHFLQVNLLFLFIFLFIVTKVTVASNFGN